MLKANGLFLIATPNPCGFPAQILKKKWRGFSPEHISLKTPYEWRNILEDYGFNILEEGTTGITGFKILRLLPFALINWVPMAIFGFFPWYKVESYMAIAREI